MSNTYEPNSAVNKLIEGFREKYMSFTDNAVSKFMNTLEKTVNEWIPNGYVRGYVYVELESETELLSKDSKVETIVTISGFDVEVKVPFPTVAVGALRATLKKANFLQVEYYVYVARFEK